MNPLIETFGWTLIHFVWQAAIVGAVLWITLWFVHAARWRYVLSCCSLLAMLGCAAFTAAKNWPEPKFTHLEGSVFTSPTAPAKFDRETNSAARPSLPVVDKSELAAGVASDSVGVPIAELDQRSALDAERWLPVVVAFWAIGVAILSLNFLRSWRALKRLRSRAAPFTDANAVSVFQRLMEKMGLTRPVALLSTDKTSVPLVVGWLRPAVIVPATLFTCMPSWQVEAILAHELAHIRRHDYLVNLLQNIVETIFFYHPAVWWVSVQMRKEREHCCDDAAAATCGNVLDYARALTGLEEIRNQVPAGALSAASGPLLGRIRRLLGVPASDSVTAFPWPVGVAIALLVFGLFASVHFVQAQEPGDNGKLPDAPEHGMSESLLLRWQQLEEKVSPVPESRVEGIRRVVENYLREENPSGDAREKLTRYRKWGSDRTDHEAADVLSLLNAIAAVNPDLIQLAFNHEPRRGSSVEQDASKFGPAGANGLRAAWELSPKRDTYVLGDVVNATLTLWNTGNETLTTGNGLDTKSPGIRPEPEFQVRGEAGRIIVVKAEPVEPVKFTAKWILKPGETAAIGGYRLKIGEGEPREAAFPTKHWSHFAIPDVRSGEAISMNVNFPYPKAPTDKNNYPGLSVREIKFSVIDANDKQVWATNRYGTWPMAGGVSMEIRGENIHGADLMTSAVLKWPDGRTVTILVAGDAFGNREPWAVAWEADKPVLWSAKSDLESMGGYDPDKPRTSVALSRVDFSDPNSVEEIHLNGWPKYNPPSAECRAALEKFMAIKAEGSVGSRSIQRANNNPTEFWLNMLNIHVNLEDNGERFHFSQLPQGGKPESLPLSELEDALRKAAADKMAQWKNYQSTRTPEQLKEMGDVSDAKPTVTLSAPSHLPLSVVNQAMQICNDAEIGPKVTLGKAKPKERSVRGLSLDGLPQSDDITKFDDLYNNDRRKQNVFFQSLGDVGPWLYFPAGADHFYLSVRPDPDVVKDIVYGPIPGNPVEKLDLAGWLRESSNHRDPGYARRVAHDMIRCGDELLAGIAFDWILTFDPPSPPNEYESLLDEVTAYLLDHPDSENAKAVSEKLIRTNAESEVAWDRKREQLSDELYQPGVAGAMRTEDGRKILWSEESDSPLRIGVAGVEEGAPWEIGEMIKLDVFVCNSSADPLRFAWTPRIDEGLSIELSDVDGNVYRAEITMFSGWIVRQRCKLEPSEMLNVKTGAEFLIGKSGAKVRNRFPVEAPGEYSLRVRCHIGIDDWKGRDGREIVRPAGEWAGEVLSDAVPVSITGDDSESAAVDAKSTTNAKSGTAWPEGELAKLPFGVPDKHGLRVARFFEPRQDSYEMGNRVEGRVVFHNTGDTPIVFVTDHWHQHDAWLCTKNGGAMVKPRIAERLGFHLSGPFRLGPGEVCELGAQGVRIGTVPYDHEPAEVYTTVDLPADAGDKFTCAWDVKLTYPGEKETTLRSGNFVFSTTKFVPDHPLELGIANYLGKYHLADGVKLQRSQSPTETMAIIEWDSGERHTIDLEHRDRKEPLVPIFWWRGGAALWIAETEAMRRVDFSDPVNVKETRWKWAETPDDYGGAPDKVQAEIQKHNPAAKETGYLDRSLREWDEMLAMAKNSDRETLKSLGFGKPEIAIPDAALPTLLALVKSGQNATKCRCLGTLKKLENPGDEILDTVIAALADETSKGNRYRAGSLLGDYQERSDYIVPRLLPLLRKDGTVEQESAAFALGKIGTAAKDALPALKAVLPGASESLKDVVETAIQSIRGNAINDKIEK
ncbi:MAG: M48 family metalloprotease [Verrucomicrobiae bacterium]|nr:M48 family metalloprotease [Verrucomicrobiae bacterium]